MTFTLTPISVKNSAGTATPMIAYNDGTNNSFAHASVDSEGAIISPATAGKQDTQTTHLSQIETATESTVTALTAANSSLDAIEASTASTVTALGTANTSLDNIETATGSTVTALTAANSSLDAIEAAAGTIATNTGAAATAANQGTVITHLSQIETATESAVTALSAANTSLDAIEASAATIGTNTGTSATGIGAPADVAASTDTGTFSLIALLKRGLQSLTSIITGTTAVATEIGKLYQPRSVAATYDGGATMTRPSNTTAYAFGDLVGSDASTPGNNKVWVIPFCRSADVPGQITGAKLFKSSTGITNAAFRIYIFRNTFTIAQNDNAAFILPAKADILGILTGSIDEVCADGAYGIFVPKQNVAIPAIPASGTANIFAVVTAVDAYTPVSAEGLGLVLEGFA